MNFKFDNNGLIPVITQDYITKDVLMFAFANQEALDLTITTKQVHYYSRSRQKLWLKGETSGHFQHVKQIRYDCDEDCLLILVEQIGGACHTGNRSCFYRSLEEENMLSEKVVDTENADALKELYHTIVDRRDHPVEGAYTNYLFDKGIDKMLKKVGEETTEVIIGAKNQNKEEIVYEVADLMYHLSVMMVQIGVTWEDVYEALKGRRK